MARILFYGPFNQRSRDTESLMIAFRQAGHQVLLLTQQEGHLINDIVASRGVASYSKVFSGPRSGAWYFFRHILYFIFFCWKHRIEIVYSHLEPANFVASVSQFFVRARVHLCRHHIDEAALYQFNSDLYYTLTYRLARSIIVVSRQARNYMIEKEGVSPGKISHINLAYDFSLYDKPDKDRAAEIKTAYKCAVLLITVARLTRYKRPEMSVQVVRRLREHSVDAKLILLGIGEMEGELRSMINDYQLSDRVVMPGYVSNVLDYMAAADYLLHPSVLDSSCVTVKEAGLARLPVMVCRGVGDFDDYIEHGVNGFVFDADHFVEGATSEIEMAMAGKVGYRELMAERLYRSVMDRFSIENVMQQYSALNH